MPSQYNDTPLNDEQIYLILEAANWAPTHRKTEPWRFKVLKGKSKNNLGEFLAEKYKDNNIKFSKFKYDRIKEKTKKIISSNSNMYATRPIRVNSRMGGNCIGVYVSSKYVVNVHKT
jgi:nitroreductase